MADKIKITDDEILDGIRPDIDAATTIQDTLADQRGDYYKRYRCQPYGNERDGWAQSVAPVIANNLRSTMPQLMEIFNEEYFTLKGDNEQRAANFQKLIAYQMFRKQDGYRQNHDFIYDACIYHYAIFKVHYREDFDLESEVLPRLSADEMMQLLQTPGTTVTKYEEVQDALGETYYEKVKVSRKVVNYAGPFREVVPPWEFYYSPDCKLDDWGGIKGRLVYHEVSRTMDEIRRRERAGIYRKGTYQRVLDDFEEASRPSSKPDSFEIIINSDDVTEFDPQPKSDNELGRIVKVKECYWRCDLDGDGLLEHAIIDLVGNTVCRVEENPYKRPPFRIGSIHPEAHKLTGIAEPEILENDQKIMTNLIRLIQDSAAQSCYRNPVTNDNTMFELLKDRKPFAAIKGDPQKLGEVKLSPPDQFILKAYQLMKDEIEEETGQTKYNQGRDAASLNKMLALDTPIPLIDGSYKLNKDIVAGDLIVGSDGKATEVTDAHPVQIPERAFEMVFRTGDVIRAGGEHRWLVKVSNKNYQQQSNWQKLRTDEIYDLMQRGHHVFIPRVKEVDFTKKDLPIDPYIFGAWLGDGNSHTNRFTSMDKEVVDAFAAWAKQFYGGHIEECKQQNSGKAKTYSIVNTPFRQMLKDLGCLRDSRYADMADNVKHIPEIYLRGSFEQRLALLRGLMDTDGHISTTGQAIFCNSEPDLIDGFARLVESFGAKPGISWTDSPANLYPNARPHAHVCFTMPYCPVSLPAKVARWRVPREEFWQSQAIFSVKEIPTEPMRCLSVSAADEQYCCGNRFTLTLNTATGISAIFNASERRIRLVASLLGNGPMKGVIRDFIFINQRWPNDDPVKLLGQGIEINPEDLDGEYDIEIDIGTSPSEKQNVANQIDLFIQFGVQAGLPMGIMQPAHLIRAQKKKYRVLGMRMDDCMMSEQEFQAAQQQMMMQQQAMQASGIPPMPGPPAQEGQGNGEQQPTVQ